MISISKDANKNYIAKVVRLNGLRKHDNADRLQIASIDFQNVITGMNAKKGDLYIYFPVECAINSELLSHTNSFNDAELNKNKEEKGFFEKNCRVKAMKLRGEKSCGYMIPVISLKGLLTDPESVFKDHVDEYFDTVNDIIICKKYVLPVKEHNSNVKKGKKPRISRLVDGQVHLHVDTENLRKEAYKIKPQDDISITYKFHGSSFWVSNVLVNRKLSIFEKILKKLNVNIVDTEYDYIFGSRKVVKNQYETQNVEDFYDGDLWGDIKDVLKGSIPKGFTLYGEVVGYTASGKFIQQGYDYGCKEGEKKLKIYRITFTNVDGVVFDLSNKQIFEFCNARNLDYVYEFYNGKAKNLFPEIKIDGEWKYNFVKNLEKEYNDKDCMMCVNKVPEEGIVIRKEGMEYFEAYKLKSFRFLEFESKQLDGGVIDMESEQ